MNWFKRKKPEPDDGRHEKRESIKQKNSATDYVLKMMDSLELEKRIHDIPFEGPEKRNA